MVNRARLGVRWGVLEQIHEDLDREVFAAYGWPATGALGLELRERLQNTDR
jgi:hypothetical protein